MLALRHCRFSLQSIDGGLIRLRRNAFSVKNRKHLHQTASRSLFTEAITSVPGPLIPPLAFSGFFLTLWTYKCLMLIAFQNKIIYMPGLPPGSRLETIEDYSSPSGSTTWEERHIKSLDGTDLALAVSSTHPATASRDTEASASSNRIVMLYFQGNGASIPPRLPQLSKTLDTINTTSSTSNRAATIIALSYRGYWRSRGKPSQKGIEQDAVSALSYARRTYPHSPIILWGQSLGASVATTLLKWHLRDLDKRQASHGIAGLILETPFVSLKAMLVALYPQKWLPYRYLHPFLRSHWDSESALKGIAATEAGRAIPILMLAAGKDELVPAEQGRRLVELCESEGMDVQLTVVPGALHVEAMSKREGRKAVAEFVSKNVKSME